MMSPDQSRAPQFVRRAAAAIRRHSAGAWLIGWLDPLHVARRLLRQAMESRAHHARGWLLDIGCGQRPYQDVFAHVEYYVGLDLPQNGRVDVYGDGMALPFRDEVFDTVLCNEVLEHVPEPARLMAEAARVLKPGGILLLTTPQTWGLHHEPHDYYRYTKYGLRYLATKSGFEVIEVSPTCGLWAMLTQRLADTVVYTYARRRAWWLDKLLSLLLAPVLLFGYAIDQAIGPLGDTLDNVLVAKKRSH
jgi:SAM-dependent methyltransferase